MTSRSALSMLALLSALSACRGVEPREAAEARAKKILFQKQIAGLEQDLGRMRGAGGLSKEPILIGVSEQVFREIVNATLPQEVALGDRVRLRIEKAEPYFRYTQGVVVFEGRLIAARHPDLFVDIRLAGGFDRVEVERGRLSIRVQIYYFEVRGPALGDMGRAAVEGIVREHMAQITQALPPIELPVSLEQEIAVKGLGEGPVSVKPGRLPFSAAVGRVTALERRLWIRIDVTAGPWQVGAPEADAPATREAAPPAAKKGEAGA